MPRHFALIILFALGVVHDLLAFRCLTLATTNKPREAAVLSAVLTAFSFGAWAIMTWTGAAETVSGIGAYAAGSGLGTWLALRSPIKPV